MQKAFTMMELIFVIVIIGILSAIALPKLGGTVNQAHIAKGKSTLAAVRSAISTERQKRILRGDFTEITSLGDGLDTFSADESGATATVLDYSIKSGCTDVGCWNRSGTTYTFYYSGGSCAFELSGNKLTGTCGVFGY